MGCGASSLDVKAKDHKAIPLLAALDEKLIVAIAAEAVKFISADYLRKNGGKRLQCRQDLEKLEREGGDKVFLSPEEAIEALRSWRRSIAALTYGWTSPDHPDVTGVYLVNVRRFLRSAHGAHILGVFWDFGSLFQWPRDKRQDNLFGQALGVMGDIYASPLGIMVIRHRGVPPRPTDLDGEVIVIVEKGGVLDGDEAVVRRTLGAHGTVERVQPNGDSGWRVRFTSRSAAEAAVTEGAAGAVDGVVVVFDYYTARSYVERGWTTFESAVSTEAIERVTYFPGLAAVLARLPPKVVEIDGDEIVPLALEAGGAEGAGPRIEKIRAAIDGAFFTGKGDKPVVKGLYNEYITNIGNAMVGSGERVDGVYEGERNAAGQREGRGTYRYASGNVEVGFYKQGVDAGEGVKWSADGLQAWRLRNGEVVEVISLGEARQTAQRLSLPIPAAVGGASPAAGAAAEASA